MKKWLLIPLLLVAACGNPSLNGIPVEEPDPEFPLFSSIRLFSDAAGVTMTNVAIAGAELTNNVTRLYIDLSEFSEARLQFSSSMAVVTNGMRIEYSLNDGSNWADLVPNFAATPVAFADTKSSWVTIPEAAKTEVLVRGMAYSTNGTDDPIIRFVTLDLRGETTGLEEE